MRMKINIFKAYCMNLLRRCVLCGTGMAALLLATACSREPATSNAAHAPTTPASSVKPGFINKVWEVSLSTGVAPGMLYAFLSDGILVITSPKSKPAFGAWTYKNGKLTMIEDSREYPTDILSLTHDELRLRSNNPGGSVEILLVPARVAPLPP